MSINLNNSRRGYHIRCKWWTEKDKVSNTLEYQNKSKGVFYAKEYQPQNQLENIDGDLVKIETNQVMIETQDNVKGIKHDCLVEYLGEKWIVDNVQTKMINKRSEYDMRPDVITWLTLRRGL